MKEKNKKSTPNDEIIREIEENIQPPENIVVLNELRSASDLHRLMNDNNSIEINPDFQRDEVWSSEGRARFIDSMSKEFPIPSMCFALDPKEQKYIVIDGLQRMSTIKLFLSNINWELPKLKDIDKRLSGKSVNEIKKHSPSVYRRIENLSLPVTILRYNPKRNDNMEYIFTIFQRINTFGERLNNQEIRNAIFQGPFNSFLKECAKNPEWIKIARVQKKGRSSRMMIEEKLLRFFAFYNALGKYSGKYNIFLNEYMQKNRFEKDNDFQKNMLAEVIRVVKRIGIENINRSNAFTDAILHGIANNIDSLKDMPSKDLQKLLQELKNNEYFSVKSLSEGTMQKSKVLNRLSIAVKTFSANK